ncbi:MAG: CPBP family intramembrane metalloprotease [Candidatus Aminicenantes bacterium]|nr:CPBP family intramembrane metalloprotease [Candidatus Aminicenantes bacterium]
MKEQSCFAKIFYFPLTRMILGGGACLAIGVLWKKVVFDPLLDFLGIEETAATSIKYFLSIMALLLSYYFIFRFYERRKIRELSTKHIFGESLTGFLGGFLSISFVLLILLIAGHFRVLKINTFSTFIPTFTAISLFALGEEIIFRGVFFRILEENLGTVSALGLSSLIFGIIHITNQHVHVLSIVSVILLGSLLGILYTLTKRLWMPIFFHAGWNFAQVFFLSNVSSLSDYEGPFESRLEGSSLLIGGHFGIEDSLITIILLAVLFSMIFYISWKNGRTKKPFWKNMMGGI